MKSFEYLSPNNIDEATGALETFGVDSKILAGGTDVLIEMRRPNAGMIKAVVDISGIRELGGIEESDGFVSVKPLSTHAQLVASSVLRAHAHFLGAAAALIGSPQIRNRGTIGGNVMNAATCADTVPALVALGARVTLKSAHDERVVPISEFFVKPYKTKALPGDMLTNIQFAKLPSASRSAFIKLGRRNALSISRLSVAAVLEQDPSGTIVDARIVPGAAFPVWRRVVEAEQMLLGEKPNNELLKAVGTKVSELMIAETGRRWSTEYKEPVIAVLVTRALQQCCGRIF